MTALFRRLRVRFSLRTLALFTLLATSGMGLWWHWEPWVLEARLQGRASRPVNVHFSQDGRRLMIEGLFAQVDVWDVDTAELVTSLAGERIGLLESTLSADGRLLLLKQLDSTPGPSKQTFTVYRTEDGSRAATMTFDEDGSRLAALSPDGSKMAIWNWDGYCKAYDVSSGAPLPSLDHADTLVTWAVFAPNSERILTTCSDNVARLWNATSGKLLADFRGHSAAIIEAKFSPSGGRILTVDDARSTRLWDTTTGKCITVVENCGPHDSFLSDNYHLVTSGDTRPVEIRAAKDGSLKATLPGSVGCSINPLHGGKIALWAGPPVTRIFDVSTGKLVLQHKGDCISISPDERRIATLNPAGLPRLLDASTGEILATLSLPQVESGYTTSSPCGTMVVTWADMGFPRLWRRRRPEWWWGVFYLWEFWLTVLFGMAVIWSIVNDGRALKAQSAAVQGPSALTT